MSTPASFDAVIMVDYSAKQTVGRRGGEQDGLWLAAGGAAIPGAPGPRPFRTRLDLQAHLEQALAGHIESGHRVLLGLDFCFGFPSGTASALGARAGEPAWSWMWQTLGAAITDTADAANNRFDVAGALNQRVGHGAGPFWGHPPSMTIPDLAPTKPPYPSSGLVEWRLVERTLQWRGAVPKSCWQLSGAGSVGGQSLVGIAMLDRMRRGGLATAWDHGAVAVWPFQAWSDAQVVVAEVYPSLVDPSGPPTLVHDARQVLGLVGWAIDRQHDVRSLLAAPLELEDPTVIGEEGWILGVPAS
ncbi:hypothetical protein [Euzebya tangerina]|uniref:hypothetical protein n=1 Tax=Euzebya tangerina TaxID=591198 RepID=UPI000E311198|nr:hypothetical protein [Euzebya tangerina]